LKGHFEVLALVGVAGLMEVRMTSVAVAVLRNMEFVIDSRTVQSLRPTLVLSANKPNSGTECGRKGDGIDVTIIETGLDVFGDGPSS